MPPFHGVLILVANILPKCAFYFLQFAEAEGRGGVGEHVQWVELARGAFLLEWRGVGARRLYQ